MRSARGFSSNMLRMPHVAQLGARLICMGMALTTVVVCGCKAKSQGRDADADGGQLRAKAHHAIAVTRLPAQAAATISIADVGTFAVHEGDSPLPSPCTAESLGGDRYFYATTTGYRIVYARHAEIFFGPVVKSVTDARQAPALDVGRNAVFAGDTRERTRIERMVEREPVAQQAEFAMDSVAVLDDERWDGRFTRLDATAQRSVRFRLRAFAQDRSATAKGLTRALRVAEFAKTEQEQDALVARMRGLGSMPEHDGELAAAILLRMTREPADRTAIRLNYACEVVTEFAKVPAQAAGHVLVGSALALLVQARSACPAAATLLAANFCDPTVRCGAAGAITPGTTSNQDEPLCTLVELDQLAERELVRTAENLVAAPYAPVAGLAFALALQSNAAPEDYTAAHARRRFAIRQPATPSCNAATVERTPCHCEPAALRDAACRSRAIRQWVGSCAFELNITQQTISNVTFTTAAHL
jgi:hypothetical protein